LKNIKWIALILVLLGASIRLLPHPPNFTPIGAIAIFGGIYFSNKKIAFLIPFLAMLMTDFFIGFAEIWITLSVYASFALITLIGIWIRKNKNIFNIFGGTLLASSTFFVITNFVVWISTTWYTKNTSGLLECYFLALPFFKNTLLGDLFYVGILIGSYELIQYFMAKKKFNFAKVLNKF